jgi:hypothetical protein
MVAALSHKFLSGPNDPSSFDGGRQGVMLPA